MRYSPRDLYTDYLSVSFGAADLWKQVKSTVREIESEDGVLIFDDTVQEKPWMDENDLIPAYQEETILEKTLSSATQLVVAGISLIMVDDGSGDHTVDKFKAFIEKTGKGTLIQHKENLGKANALNSGLKKINTPFVLTLDADTSVEVDAVRAATAQLLDKLQRDATVVAFDVSVKPSSHLFRELQELEYDGSVVPHFS